MHIPHCPSTAIFYLHYFGLIYSIFHSDVWALMRKVTQVHIYGLQCQLGPVLLSIPFTCKFYMLTPSPIFLDTCSTLLPLFSTSQFHSYIPSIQQSHFHTVQEKQKLKRYVRKMSSLLAYLSFASRLLLLLFHFFCFTSEKSTSPLL